MNKNMRINFGKSGTLSFDFAINQSPITDVWLERMSIRSRWPMDNPDRFYGFNSYESEKTKAFELMQHSISVVNNYKPIIEKPFVDVFDQDTLNYLHNIFERFHGQLEKQDHEFWQNAPAEVKQALADINIHVHRCESLRSGKMLPRFVCTWYGMPKDKTLDFATQNKYGVEASEFGGVYLNYAEIGKTAANMAYDNDKYMADEMFQPFSHCSADFRVNLYSENKEEVEFRRNKTYTYVKTNFKFFEKFGITQVEDPRITPLWFKVAQMIYTPGTEDDILDQIRQNQYVHSVVLT